MRFRYLLPAVMLTAGSALAQAGAPIPNAIGVWKSDSFGFIGWNIGTGFPAGQAGNQMWQAFPPELTTYFRGGQNRNRELDFRGFEMSVTHFNNAAPALNGPRMQLRNAVGGTAGIPASRFLPGATVYVNFPSVANLIGAGTFPGTHIKISMLLGTAVTVPIAANLGTNSADGALMAVWQDFEMTKGDGGFFPLDLLPVSTTTESQSGGDSSLSYSGGSTILPVQNFLLPQPLTGSNTGGEYCITYFFEQSMIQPVKNGRLVSATGQILGGGTPPAAFTTTEDDGRGAIHPRSGDWVSYRGNSSYGNPGPAPFGGNLGTTWFVPFVLFSGDVPDPFNFSIDPAPEVWNTGNAWIYKEKIQQWIFDFCALTAACDQNTLPQQLNPNLNNYGIWLGLDLPNGLFNFTVFTNSLVFADTSAGPQYAGPATMAYDSALNPFSLLARNLVNAGAGFVTSPPVTFMTGVREHRTLTAGTGPQTGYTPVTVFNGPSQLGFGVVPAALGGMTYHIQCWMLDLNILQIVDTTNVAVLRLQN